MRDSSREIRQVAMSVTVHQRTEEEIWEEEILDNPEVCNNCYTFVYELVLAKKIIRGERDYGIFGDDKKCYLRVTPLNEHPMRLRINREDNTDEEYYCSGCGREVDDYQKKRPRDIGKITEHARNAHQTLKIKGVNIDRKKFVGTVRDLKKQPRLTGKEDDEIMPRALARASEVA